MEELFRTINGFNESETVLFWAVIFAVIFLISLFIWTFLSNKKNIKNPETAKAKIEGGETIFQESRNEERGSTIKVLTSYPIIKDENNNSTNEVKELDVIYKEEKVENQEINLDIKENNIKEIDILKEQNFENTKKPIETEREKRIEVSDTILVDKLLRDQILETIEETEKSDRNIIYVDYDFPKDNIINSYPILMFPKKGTIIRSHRIGKSKRRGHKEESFQRSISIYFGDSFEVLGNARLNTGKGTRPFEPDIAIIGKASSSRLRIDIEIDEPYAALSRKPIHCDGEDRNRDIYFIDRGWIVIRFSEHQVHLFEKKCLKFIVEIIQSIDPSYKFPFTFNEISDLPPESLWDLVQAQKWENIKYREEYLEHTFLPIEEKPEKVDRDFNEQELLEEGLVQPTQIGVVDTKLGSGFNPTNAHPRDERICFYPDQHIYTIDKVPATSVTTLISKFFPEFDAYGKASTLSTKHPLFGMKVEEIVRIWRENGTEAAGKGTLLHEQIEKFYLGEDFTKTEEFHLFGKFVADHTEINPHRSEWRIFDEDYNIAGTIDLISKNGEECEIYDWKRSKKVINVATGKPISEDSWGNVGIGKLSSIDDTSYNRYCIQQSIYKYILEKRYDLKISKMYLIVLYPEYPKYYKVDVPYRKDVAEYILNTL